MPIKKVADEKQSSKIATKACPLCKGTGLALLQPPKRFTTGGKNEPQPCPKCDGIGEA